MVYSVVSESQESLTESKHSVFLSTSAVQLADKGSKASADHKFGASGYERASTRKSSKAKGSKDKGKHKGWKGKGSKSEVDENPSQGVDSSTSNTSPIIFSRELY